MRCRKTQLFVQEKTLTAKKGTKRKKTNSASEKKTLMPNFASDCVEINHLQG